MNQKSADLKAIALEEFLVEIRNYINEFSDYSDYPTVKRLINELQNKVAIINAIELIQKNNRVIS